MENFYLTILDFEKLTLVQRYKVLSESGCYISKRLHRGMEVFLYKVDEFYVELWKRYMLSDVVWIEVVPENTISKYIDSVDLKALLSASN